MCASRRESDERAPLLDQPLHTVPLVFFDLETTGLFPHRGDRVCEVALLRERGGEPERRFETLVNPQRPLSEQSFLVNGIRAEELAGAPLFAEAAGPLRAISEGAVLVAHNAPFDMEFLHTELARAGLPPIAAPVIDTLALARRLSPRRPSHSLKALALALGAPAPSHRAMGDVLALRAVFADMAAQLATRGIRLLGDVLRYARGFDPGQPEPAAPPPIATALAAGQLLRVRYSSRAQPELTERIIRPIEIVRQRETLFLRAYCYFRQDLRAFVIDKLHDVELIEDSPA